MNKLTVKTGGVPVVFAEEEVRQTIENGSKSFVFFSKLVVFPNFIDQNRVLRRLRSRQDLRRLLRRPRLSAALSVPQAVVSGEQGLSETIRITSGYLFLWSYLRLLQASWVATAQRLHDPPANSR